MDQRSIDLLEFPAIRARLAAATSFGPSRRLAEALEPSSDPVLVARALDETDQARRPAPGAAGSRDRRRPRHRPGHRAGGPRRPPRTRPVPRDRRRRSTRPSRLATLLADERRPLLRDLGRELHALPALRSTLARSFDPVGELLDTASPRLGGLRSAVRVAYDRLRRRLDSLVGSELGNALQEPIITLRNGRYVVPVKSEARSRVKGIVHDASGSGQTLFIEPLVAVELGNAWREAQVAEAEEIARILDELSAFVAANADALRETLEALAQFDFWAAKASLASEMRASRAETTERTEAILLSARHPGLSGTVIPIDIRLGDGYTALVVTGPNTGGKTVTLRTLGLLSLMHQAGLHVPAEPGSRLPVWRDVFADIGDEQSIAQSLSTFSGHLRSIIRIVEAAGPGTLVLLDELGAGTDPTEGSALAQALLDHFIRAGALVAATTHYAELKAYAHTTPEARNAAVEFDLETLSPTYRLTIGLPGGSQAFAIAERLGLPEPIVGDARSRLSEAQRSFEATLASIKATEGETGEALDRARAAELRATEALRIAQEERRRARRERDEAVRAARLEAERIVDDLRTEVRDQPRGARARDRHRTGPRRGARPGRGRARPAPGRRRDGRAPPRSRTSSGTGGSASGRAACPAAGRAGSRPSSAAASGRPSRPAGCGSRSMSTTSSRRSATTSAERGANGAGRSAPTRTSAELRVERARSVASSLDLRGARVDEALEALDRYLDDAGLAGLDKALIIHGMGTGALRDAVRSTASSHPLVKSMRPGQRGEGGDGATIVEF